MGFVVFGHPKTLKTHQIVFFCYQDYKQCVQVFPSQTHIMTTKRSITLNGEIYWAAVDVVAEIYKIMNGSASYRLKKLCKCKMNGLFVSKLLSRKQRFVGSGSSLTSIINAAEIETLREYLSYGMVHSPRVEKGTKRIEKGTRRSVILDEEIYWVANDIMAEICKCTSKVVSQRLYNLSRREIEGPPVSELLSRKHQFPGEPMPVSIINTVEIEELENYLKSIQKVEKGTKRSVTLDGEIYWAANDVAAEIFGNDYYVRPSNRLYVLSQDEINGPHVSKLLSRKHKFAGKSLSIINAAEIEELHKIVINTQKTGKKGFVYVGYSKGNGTKIGMTTRDDPKTRLKDANTYIRHPYELLDYIQCENPNILENCIHNELDEYKICEHNRELFDLPDDLIMTFFHYIKKALKGGQDVSRDMVSVAMIRTLEEGQLQGGGENESLNFLGHLISWY